MATTGEKTAREGTAQLKALRRPIPLIAASNLAIMAIGLVFLFQYWRLGAGLIFWTLCAALAVVALNLLFLRATGRAKLAGYVSTTALFVLLVVAVSQSGGFYDPSFAWLLVVPLAAAFLVDFTALLVFLALVLAATVGFWLVPPEATPSLIPTEMHGIHSLFNRIGALAALGVMTAFFMRGQYFAQKLLRGANRELEREAGAHARTAEALTASEARYRDLVENSADLIWTHDLEGKVLSANEAFLTTLGHPEDELLGVAFSSLVDPGSAARWQDYLEVVRDRGTFRGTMDLLDSRGSARTLEFHNTLKDDGDGPPVVRGLAREVTQQVAAQALLERRVEQEQLMVAISTRFIDTGADQVSATIEGAMGEIGRFLDCDRLSFFLGRARDQRFERLCGWSRLPPEEGERRAVAIPRLRARLEQFETVAVTRLGELDEPSRQDLVTLLGAEIRSAAVVPVFGRHGLLGLLVLESVESEREWRREDQAVAHIGGVVFGNAITRARDEERGLRLQAEIQQARKMESLGLIAGGIAHDFNNLLMVVLGNSSLAMSQVSENSAAHEALQAIDSSARRAAKLTAQMLAYAGGGTLERRSLDLGEVVESEIAQQRAGAEDQIELRTSFAPGLPEIFADEGLVRQMLRAILKNALEAIGQRVGVVQVSTRAVELEENAEPRGFRPIRRSVAPGTYGVLEIRDSGPGVEPGALQKVFDPFFSTKFAGRGLGLAAVLGVVRGHDGVVEIESDPSGTSVRIFIPVGESEASLRSIASPMRPLVSERNVAEPAVVVLDSDPAVLAVMNGLLASGGFDTVGTRSAEEAAEILGLGEIGICAVVADLAMFESSEALQDARRNRTRIPWILSSDEETADDVSDRLAETGASAFLSKPFEGGRLLSLLEGLLREYDLDGPGEARPR